MRRGEAQGDKAQLIVAIENEGKAVQECRQLGHCRLFSLCMFNMCSENREAHHPVPPEVPQNEPEYTAAKSAQGKTAMPQAQIGTYTYGKVERTDRLGRGRW